MTWEGGGKPKIVTNDDMGGRGVKNFHFYGDVIFERPRTGLEVRSVLNTILSFNQVSHGHNRSKLGIKISTNKVVTLIKRSVTKL